MKSSGWRLFAALAATIFISAAWLVAAPNPLAVAIKGPVAPSVTATATSPSPDPMPPGQTAKSTLNATSVAPTSGPGGPTYGAPTWSWAATGEPGISLSQPNSGSPAATFKGTNVKLGAVTVTVTATATWKGSDGTSISAKGSTTITFKVVGVQSLQYFQPKSIDVFLDVPATLYVLTGESVRFRAIPTPAGDFPDANPVWSGTSGVSGMGRMKNVKFSARSTSKTDFKTVKVTCGNTHATVNVVVFDLAPKLTPQDNFKGRDLDNYGVCELINLSFSTLPAEIGAGAIGLKWAIETGRGVLTDNGDGTGVYECADVAATASLRLQITDGPTLGAWTPLAQKDVVPPKGNKMAKYPNSGLWHKNTKPGGQQGCHVKLDMWAQGAKNVSYKRIECREGVSDPAVALGGFAAFQTARFTRPASGGLSWKPW